LTPEDCAIALNWAEKEDDHVSDILEDLSTPALVKAIRANMFELFRYLGRSPEAELYDGPNLTWLLTRIPTPFLNGVLRTQLTRDNADEAIEETLAHFKSRNVHRLWWWTEPDAQPADLAKRLVAHGLTHAEDPPGMAVDLLALNEELTTPSDLTIEHVGDTDILKQCVHAAIVGLGLPSTGESAFFNLLISLGFDLPLRNYVGFLNGEPVASSGLFLAAGVAGIYWVATVPEARRQGIGTALTLAPLCEARAMGYRIGILHSSEIGLGVYSRLGFQKYCRMSHYEWACETSQ
jgi:predicted GNAT family acetyltransferase